MQGQKPVLAEEPVTLCFIQAKCGDYRGTAYLMPHIYIIIKKLQAHNIIYINNKKHLGISEQRNIQHIFILSLGSLILFLDKHTQINSYMHTYKFTQISTYIHRHMKPYENSI